MVLTDTLPATGLTYGAPVGTATGGATGTLACAVDGAFILACTAGVGGATIPAGGGFQVAFTAVASAPGTYVNPRAGSTCLVDPNTVIAETNEANNACTNTVVVGGLAAAPPSAALAAPEQGVSTGPNNDADDEDKDRHLSETQRHQRSHTNASGQDDYRTEGNILEVRCDASAPPEYEVTFPTHTPYLVIATRDGIQQLRLLYDTRSQCKSAQVGGYAEADGEKQTEQLFDVHELTLKRPR